MKTYNGKRTSLHRCEYARLTGLSWAQMAGKVVMHLCDNPACAEPSHLTLDTQSANLLDMRTKGRDDRTGDRARNIKITSTHMPHIRLLLQSGHMQWEVAAFYSVNQSVISRALKRYPL